MKLSWLNTSMGTHKQYQAYMYDMNNMKQCKVKKREFRDSGSIANTKICFEVQATALCPRLHIEGFPLYIHTGLPTQGTSIEDLIKTNYEYTTSLSNKQPLHKRQGTIIITSH